MNEKQRMTLIRIIIVAVLVLLLYLIPDVQNLPMGDFAHGFVFYCIAYIIISYDIFYKAFRGIKNGQVLDENFLMVFASLGAFALTFYEQNGDYLESIAVMLFYQVGELFESYAVGKSRRDISALMDIRPDYAHIETETGELQKVDPDDVEIGQIIVVQPGEKVPIDGVVVVGSSSLNTVALTGESLPRKVREGEDVLSGSINMTGVLKVRTTKEFGESTVSKILELVEDSASHRARSEAFITRFARIYTPIVCISALLLALVPPLIQMIVPGMESMWRDWIYRALTVLVISCPCALVISIPLSFFAGIGGASREGILVKGANILETLSKVKTVVFDKTGTLTLGVFEVTAMHDIDDATKTNDVEKMHLLEMAVIAECASSHPISKSLQRAYGKPIDHSRVKDIQELSGHGILACIDGKHVAVGNEKLMQRIGVPYCHCQASGTIVHVVEDGLYIGHIVLGDVIKPHTVEAIKQLHTMGIRDTVILTGDNRCVAGEVAKTVGVDKVYYELLPADKVKYVEDMIRRQPEGEKLVFVGDGINDAPVLTRADIGIAMGGLGSDAAIDAADVVLMDDDTQKIAMAIEISRKTLRIVWQNIVMALGIKIICLLLGALGIANMWLAIFADVGVLIIAVLNAMRAMSVVKK